MSWLSALPVVGSALDAGLGFISANQQNQWNRGMAHEQQNFQAQQAQEQMAFQERMSSTAHQREVEDLRKAGLNPILSAGSGASSPGGAMAGSVGTPQAAQQYQPGFLQRGFAQARDQERLDKELREADARIKTEGKMQVKLDADAQRERATARRVELENNQIENRAKIEKANPWLSWVDTVTDRIPVGGMMTTAASAILGGVIGRAGGKRPPFKGNIEGRDFKNWARQEMKDMRNWNR